MLLYEQFDRFELDNLSKLNEYDNYIEYREIREDRNINNLLIAIFNGEKISRKKLNYYKFLMNGVYI